MWLRSGLLVILVRRAQDLPVLIPGCCRPVRIALMGRPVALVERDLILIGCPLRRL